MNFFICKVVPQRLGIRQALAFAEVFLGQMASHRALRYSFLKFKNFKKAAAPIAFAVV
ncbi:hypothetical protein [Aestuariivivens insulae]|uniref:hypothetical protein n=1 Tax=Aestuariivivens insulae TaxID=1621988 RepID=UPI001F5AC842|nr:hypothetical protein [Aestuariivivens insulae]